MEGSLIGFGDMVPILYQNDANQIGHKFASSKHSERCWWTLPLQQRARSQAVYQASKASPSGTNPVCQASSCGEPLRNDICGSDVEESHTPAEAHTLAQKQVPDLIRKRGTDKRRCEKYEANRKRRTCSPETGGGIRERRNDESLGKREAANKGIIKRCSIRIDIV